MKVSWKITYALCCTFFLFLLPFVYADETVEVFFYKDGVKIDTPEKGDTIYLKSELINANSSDYIKYSLQDDNLKFVENPNGTSINTYGRFEDNLWKYETKVEVIGDNPILPKAQIIRDSSQPDLSESEKPESISIDLNSEQIVSPGDSVTVKARLEPEATVNKNYYNYISWNVKYGSNELLLENNSGEAITFKVPDEAVNEVLEVTAILNGSSCGLAKDLVSETKSLKVQDNSLTVQIFPSTDSEGIIKGKYIGFSSEILRNGKVAETSISENSEYTWNAKIGDEFINGHKDNRTNYTVSPDRLGTLTVSLTVTLKNGITLESQTVTKTVVEEEQILQSINIRKIENGESYIDNQIEVTKELEPQYVTNLDEASFKWSATQNEEEIANSNKNENFIFTPKKSGPVSVILEIKPKDSDPIISEALIINVLEDAPEQNASEIEYPNISEDNQTPTEDLDKNETNSNESKEGENSTGPNLSSSSEIESEQAENSKTSEELESNLTNKKEDNSIEDPYIILSGIIKSNKTKVNIGENVIMNASLSTKGKNGDINYNWKAIDSEGNILSESQELKDFTFTSKKPGDVDVSFSVVVKNNKLADSIEEPSFQRLDLKETINFMDNLVNIDNLDNNSDSDSKLEESSKVSNINTINYPETQKDSSNETKAQEEILSSELKTEEKQVSSESNYVNSGLTSSLKDSKIENNGIGLNNIKNETNPISLNTTKSNSSPVNSSNTSSVLNKSSNIVNPKTGTELTFGQIGVIAVCFTLIVVSIIILIRKAVSFNK